MNSAGVVLPEPLPWVRRGSAAPYVPGAPDELVDNLRALLEDIRRNPVLDRDFTYPGSAKKTTLRQALHPLGSSGLVRRNPQLSEVFLTEAAEQFLDNGDQLFLMAILHANIRFFGEVLTALGDGIDHETLNRIASDVYGLSWSSLDQIRRRVYWLRGTGLVEHWTNGLVVPTEAGRRFLRSIEPVDIDSLPHRREHEPGSIVLPGAGSALAERLARIDQAGLLVRKRQLGYVAGGGIESIRTLVDFVAAVPATRAAFTSFCTERFEVATSSADQTLNSLRIMGLVVQVGADSFTATDLARDWLSSGETLDLLRIVHLNVSLVGETLDVLGEHTNTGEATRVLAERHPDHAPSRAEVGRKIALFLEAGLVERLGVTLRRTPLGSAFAASLPLQSGSPTESAQRVLPDAGTEPGGRLIDEIIAELDEAAVDSGTPTRFEKAVEAAFRALGVVADHHGGPSRTDVLVEVWDSPTSRIRVAVEAKTDGAGIITDKDVEFNALEEHRAFHRAGHSLLIGPVFSGRVMQWAEKNQVGVLTASELSRALRRHQLAPLFPHEIASLLDLDGVAAVDEVWDRVERRQETFSRVVSAMWSSANDPVDVEYSKGVLTPPDIWRESKNSPAGPLELPEIKGVLDFLASPMIAAVVPQGNGHVAAAPPVMVAARLRALAAAIDAADPTLLRAAPVTARVPGPPRPKANLAPNAPSVSPDLVRAWAGEQGRSVSSRGRLPGALIRDYKRAHGLGTD